MGVNVLIGLLVCCFVLVVAICLYRVGLLSGSACLFVGWLYMRLFMLFVFYSSYLWFVIITLVCTLGFGFVMRFVFMLLFILDLVLLILFFFFCYCLVIGLMVWVVGFGGFVICFELGWCFCGLVVGFGPVMWVSGWIRLGCLVWVFLFRGDFLSDRG